MTKDISSNTGSRVAPKRRNSPGRPVGVSNLREKILDAAEVDFADHGFAGATLREVANACGVTQALITYHFGTKHRLFEEVFLRRATRISEQRLELLHQLAQNSQKPSVSDIVRSFLEPMLTLRRSPGGRAFIRLHARLHTEPPEISYRLRGLAYDESTHAYVAAFRSALPEVPEKDLYWRVMLMIGAYLYAFSDSHRLEVLSEGACNTADATETLEQLTAFIVGGLAAPHSGKPPKAVRKRK
ncbi:bacterial regulatory s, tetR family protein [Paraburkholderia xenovorans LB400]|uniref:Transcriptional regulator, TetR family n=1 Tax=Paraburkholderia xenovorans (strain LB400) TaxID=266265 RepID=Q13IF3_PARXL|nr:TetR/AcrR family transcriptional regulator [Paraburkholderia xenovorans]ABE36136.1 transcriptional regulator, TetR family [Paraburkholderia xenovorans LB400]AIP34969.1 bacterial regulatory s, tetR family protein [Paraburkholderia xenovorans LB400]